MQGGRLFGLTIGIATILVVVLAPAAASAQTYNQRLTIYATVPEQRAVYTDQSGNIIKVVGNTANNIEPKAYDYKNQLILMSPTIQQQYDEFLKSHGKLLAAGKTYWLNPVKVNTTINDQTIRVDTTGLRLGSVQSG